MANRPYYTKILDSYNKQAFVDLITKGIPYNEYVLTTPTKIPKSKFAKQVSARFQDPVWINMKTFYTQALLAKIQTPHGDFTVFRNGWNAGFYNFAIISHDTGIIYWATNVEHSLDTLEALSCKQEDLPLFLGHRSKKILNIVSYRLQGDLP